MRPFSEFSDPPAHYRAMPFWFWNGKLEIPRLRQQIADMHDKGMGGFFVHARFGLDTPYMSDEWMDCVKASIETASELGMEVWLYDEANFPSGLSDLKVTAHREFRSKFVDLIEDRVVGPSFVGLEVPDGEVLAAQAIRYENDRPIGKAVDLMGMIHEGQVDWNVPHGEWQVMVFVLHVLDAANSKVFGLDYLNPDATKLFIETTHEVYARELGEHFGKTVKGFFVDEPTLLPWHHDIAWYGNRANARVVVWSPRLQAELERQGLPADDVLPHLFYTLDETSADKRKSFYRTVNRMYTDSFFRPYREWCDDHGLELTGHLLLEEGLYCNTIFQADPVPPLSQMHVPGTDHLGLGAEGPYGGWAHLPRTITNVQGEKLVTSVGHLMTDSRVLSETFGCAGWGLTLQDMKRITDWQYSIGVNFMCPHAFFYTIEGYRKTDAPPSHNHSAIWPYYRHYGDYVGRLSYMLSGGTHIAQVAVLYPLPEFQGVYEIGREGDEDRRISDGFDAVCTVLPQIQYDYDIVHQQLLPDARVEDGKLYVGGETFDALVLPPLANVDPAVQERLREMRESGLTMVALDSGEAELAGSHVEVDSDDLEALGRALRDKLGQPLRADVLVDADEGDLSAIRFLHRLKDGRDIYFLINTADAERTASISLNGEMAVEVFDLETGKTCPINAAIVDGRTNVAWSFPPHGSLMLVSAAEPVSADRAEELPPIPKQVIDLGDEWEFRTEQPNCLILDRWEMELFSRGNTGRFNYRAFVEMDDVPRKGVLVLDDIEYRQAFMGGMDITILVNDSEWSNPSFGEYMDPGFKMLDITSALQQGLNEFFISIRHDGWSGEPKLLTSTPRLLGDFEIVSLAPYRIRKSSGRIAPGSWAEQGYPYYSGTAEYRTTFELPEDFAGRRSRLVINDVADMFEVVVNDEPIGVRPWRPWEIDLGDLVGPGENTIVVKVTNSMQNFLEGLPKPSGLLGKAQIEIME